jgi:nucleoside-triphosphatase
VQEQRRVGWFPLRRSRAPTIRPVKVLVEGRPGSGKTTVAARLARLLADEGVDIRGFLTQEIREAGRRRAGFGVEAIGGARATLAHVSLPGPPRVGKYGVDLEAFERVALPALEGPPPGAVVVIDELGKMELHSDRFREAMSRLFDDTSVDLVATVHVFRHPFTDQLKQRDDVERIKLTRAGRDALPQELAERLASRRG